MKAQFFYDFQFATRAFTPTNWFSFMTNVTQTESFHMESIVRVDLMTGYLEALCTDIEFAAKLLVYAWDNLDDCEYYYLVTSATSNARRDPEFWDIYYKLTGLTE